MGQSKKSGGKGKWKSKEKGKVEKKKQLSIVKITEILLKSQESKRKMIFESIDSAKDEDLCIVCGV